MRVPINGNLRVISIERTFVVSLVVDVERRRHIDAHFGELGIGPHEFVDAVTGDDPAVKDAYDQGVVAAYPPCFRCGEVSCDCFNNILIPQQVANWLSFRKIWKALPPDADKYFLICEDDVAFHNGAIRLLRQFLADFKPEHEQVLIRMSQSGLEPYQTLDVERLSTRWGPVMSNAAYILNGAMAARLLREPFKIAQTSDNWLHGEIGAKPDVHAVTLDPLLATDLSYNELFAQFRSRIHPKGIDTEDTARQSSHTKRVESVDEYEDLRTSWFAQPEHRAEGVSSNTKPASMIFVLGMHRSGTSALVRTLNLLGYEVPKNLLAANQDNPFGYWEPKTVVAFNNRLLKHFDRHWSDPKPLPDGWQCAPGIAEWIAEAAEILRTLIDEREDAQIKKGLVIKDPRLSLTFPVWREAAAQSGIDVSCFIMYRDPWEVAQSLETRDEVSRDHANRLWLNYTLEAEHSSRGLKRAAIAYEDLLKDWKQALGACDVGLSSMSDSELETAERVIGSFLRPELRHHHAERKVSSIEKPLEEDVAAVLSILSELHMEQPEPFDRVRQRIQKYWMDTSPGPAASGLSDQLPARQAELSWELYAKGKLEEAAAAARRAIELSPRTMRYHYILGHHLDKLHRLEEAAAAFRKAIALDAREARVFRALISVLKKLGQTGEAITTARSLSEMELSRADDHLLLCDLLLAEGRTEAAISSLQLARAAHPNSVEIIARLESILLAKQDTEAALRAAMDAVVSDLDYAERTQAPVSASGFRTYLAHLTVRYWANDLLDHSQPARIAPELSVAWPYSSNHPGPKRGIPASFEIGTESKTLSVMIPVFDVDREDWLVEAINGVLSQTEGRDDVEVVIMDDASSNQVARQVASRFGDRVRYSVNETNLGLVGNHNKCILEAKGKFIHFLHQDDRVKPGFYETMLTALMADDRLVAGFCQTGYISSSERPENVEPALQSRGELEDWPTKLSLYRIQFPTMLVRRQAYLELGGFSPSFEFAFDWHFWSRLCASGPVWYEPQALAQYRVHDGSATHSFGWKERVVEAMQVVATMVRWVPEDQRQDIAERALFKFIYRYWTLVASTPASDLSVSQIELLEFFLRGWGDAIDPKRLVDRVSKLA